MTNQAIKVIGFDLDNTLYPSTPEIQKRIRTLIYEKISSEFGISFNEAERLFEEGYYRLCSGTKALEEIARQHGRESNPKIIQEALQEADILDLIMPNPELQSMLSRLSKSKRLDLLTGSTYDLALQKLERIGICREIFEYILSGEEHGSKSDGTIYRHWLNLRDYAPYQIMYVGDNTRQDIDAPKKLGIKTCYVGGSYEEANFCIDEIFDLEKIV